MLLSWGGNHLGNAKKKDYFGAPRNGSGQITVHKAGNKDSPSKTWEKMGSDALRFPPKRPPPEGAKRQFSENRQPPKRGLPASWKSFPRRAPCLLHKGMESEHPKNSAKLRSPGVQSVSQGWV